MQPPLWGLPIYCVIQSSEKLLEVGNFSRVADGDTEVRRGEATGGTASERQGWDSNPGGLGPEATLVSRHRAWPLSGPDSRGRGAAECAFHLHGVAVLALFFQPHFSQVFVNHIDSCVQVSFLTF